MSKDYFDEHRAYPDGIPDFESLRTNMVLPAVGKTFVLIAETKDGHKHELMLADIHLSEEDGQYRAGLYRGKNDVSQNDVFSQDAWEYIEDVSLSKDKDQQLRVLGPVAIDPESIDKNKGLKSKKLWAILGGAAAVGVSGVAVYYLKKKHPGE